MDELRAQTGLGRATISEAARLLEERGTVDVRPGRGGGLFVAAAGPFVRLRHTLLAVDHDRDQVAHAIAVRDALEDLIATDAASHRDEDDIRELRSIITEMETTANDRGAFLSVNWKLHRRIAEITPNELASGVYLSMMAHAVGRPSHADTATADDEPSYLELRIHVHAELVESIASGDAARTSAAVAAHRALAIPARRARSAG